MFRKRSVAGIKRAAGGCDRRGASHRAVSTEPVRLEDLEQRTLLFAWTPEEVYLAELVNRARADPMAEGVRVGLDLTEGLTEAELARLVPQEPLALNAFLTTAARAHSLDMAQRGFFDHINPDGDTPTDRAQAAGYGGTAGENIAAGQESIDEAHFMWLESLGHRKNIFSLPSTFSDSFHYDEFGPGFAFTDIGPYFDYYTEAFGYQGTNPSRFVLGVVFNDASGDEFYSIGEGMADVRIDAAPTDDPDNVVASYTTDAAGNYQMALAEGDYNITFTNLGNGKVFTRSITIGSVNVKVDAQADQFSAGAPGDDHADAGNFADATAIPVDAFTGAGSSLGELTEGDTDLFRFTSPVTGRISFTTSSAANVRLRIYNGDGLPVATGSPSAPFDSAFSFHVAQNQTYYAMVESSDGSTGNFALLVSAVADTDSNSEDPVLSGVGDAEALITLAMLDASSHPLVMQQDATGAWHEYDLFEYAGGPDVSGDVETFVDPHDGLNYAVVKSDTGLILFRQDAEGGWTFRNLTAEIDGAGQIVSDLGVFTAITGETFVSGLDADGDLVIYRQTGALLADGHNLQWTFENLAENHLRAQGQEVPAFVGKLTSYVTSWGGLNIAGLDADGNIHVVWWAPGLELWQHNNLTEQTGAAPLAGALTAYMTPWNGINLAGIDVNGKLSVTWWVPEFQGNWANNNLTDETGGPLLNPDTVSSYVTGWGGLNVAGVDEDGDLQVYWWAPGQTVWEATNLSQVVVDAGFNDAQPLADNATTGVTVLANGDINVFATEADGDVVRFQWEIGGWWEHQNVTHSITTV